MTQQVFELKLRIKELLDLLGDAAIHAACLRTHSLECVERQLIGALEYANLAVVMPTHKKARRVKALIKQHTARANQRKKHG